MALMMVHYYKWISKVKENKLIDKDNGLCLQG